MSKKRLDKGLDALLGNSLSDLITGDESIAVDTYNEPDLAGSLRNLPIDLIDRGTYQPRREFAPEQLEELAESIRQQGVIQPIFVRPTMTGRYELIAGERRWRASQLAGLSEIPAMVKDVDDRNAAALSLIENMQREDLNPIEEALGLQRLADEFGLNHQQIADAVGKSRTGVSNMLRLLGLNADVKQLLQQGELEMGHARALLPLDGKQQVTAARRVIAQGLSVRETEKLVRQLLSPAQSSKAPYASVDPDILRLQDQLSEQLGAKVQIQHQPNGKGRLSIDYHSLEELDGILAHMRVD